MKKVAASSTYAHAFEHTSNGIFICDANGQFIFTNTVFCEMLGYGQDELTALNLNEIYAIDDLDPYMQQVATFGEGKVSISHRAIQKKNKEIFYAQVTLMNLGNNLMQGFITPSPVNKNILDKLIDSEQRFKQITDHIRDVFFLLDLKNKKFLYISPGYTKIFDRSTESLYAHTSAWMDTIHPEDKSHIEQQFARQFKTGTFEETFRHIKENGDICWLHARAYPVFDAHDQLYRSTGFIEDVTEQIARAQEKLIYAEKINKSFNEMLSAFSVAMEQRDPYTVGHQKNVAYLAVAIAQTLGLSHEKIKWLEMAALTHDIGKIGIPSQILNKPSRLTPLEFDMIKTHAQIGYEILKQVDFFGPVADIVLEHHERLNGSGYPRGLKGDEIRLETRVLSVADTVDAMTSFRPYRAPLGIEVALAEISKGRGVLFDEQVIDACIKLFNENKLPLYRQERK